MINIYGENRKIQTRKVEWQDNDHFGFRPDDFVPLILQREPENSKDSNVVKVVLKRKQQWKRGTFNSGKEALELQPNNFALY